MSRLNPIQIATPMMTEPGLSMPSVDKANMTFRNELSGSPLAKASGITDASLVGCRLGPKPSDTCCLNGPAKVL